MPKHWRIDQLLVDSKRRHVELRRTVGEVFGPFPMGEAVEAVALYTVVGHDQLPGSVKLIGLKDERCSQLFSLHLLTPEATVDRAWRFDKTQRLCKINIEMIPNPEGDLVPFQVLSLKGSGSALLFLLDRLEKKQVTIREGRSKFAATLIV